MDPTNKERAERAEFALGRYADESGSNVVPADASILTDFLTDAMHLFGRETVLECLRIAEGHHQAELDEEGPQ